MYTAVNEEDFRRTAIAKIVSYSRAIVESMGEEIFEEKGGSEW